jgi:hypothetical protein
MRERNNWDKRTHVQFCGNTEEELRKNQQNYTREVAKRLSPEILFGAAPFPAPPQGPYARSVVSLPTGTNRLKPVFTFGTIQEHRG